ncbi:hypothetical protein [Massilia aerilata]|uniref:Uncharacterized protein n=1 Tax=Massilia aerilata TaxID=453817 RepID=A0ABW0S3G9_9BURK
MALNGKLMVILATMTVLAAPVAMASGSEEGAITGVSAVTSSKLALYSGPAQARKVKEVPKEEIKLPLPVNETDEEERFLKVKLDGEVYWLSRKQVSVTRAVSVGCLAQASAPVEGATIRGANEGCKK